MKVFTFSTLLVSLLFVFPAVSSGKNLPKIAVWDLEPRNTPEAHAKELTSILVSEISKLRKYEVYSQENVRTVAGWTAERMKLGCTDTQCLTALGQMDIAKLISGSVGKIGNRYSISLNVFDTQKAEAENAVSEFCNSEDELIELIQQTVRKLFWIDPLVGDLQKPRKKRIPFDWMQEKCLAPQWQIGDKWTYKLEDGKFQTEEVVEVEKDLYILDMGMDRRAYDKRTMNVKWLIDVGGKRKKFTGWDGKNFDFPLYIGKKWSHYGKSPGYYYDSDFEVEDVEEMVTTQGIFKSYRIKCVVTNTLSHRSGLITWWYSPEIKNYVRLQRGGLVDFWTRGHLIPDKELRDYELK